MKRLEGKNKLEIKLEGKFIKIYRRGNNELLTVKMQCSECKKPLKNFQILPERLVEWGGLIDQEPLCRTCMRAFKKRVISSNQCLVTDSIKEEGASK